MNVIRTYFISKQRQKLFMRESNSVFEQNEIFIPQTKETYFSYEVCLTQNLKKKLTIINGENGSF